MMQTEIKLLDVVALTEDLPQKGVYRGQVGTIVELLTEGVFLVEFSDNQGHTYAMLSLKHEQLMVLYDEPIKLQIA
ncbi:DUF4926 domain-containing protein [Oscillatoriales cyanobacterium USR001]|nr:DUF4926 domain-containing protein [Oscillatoriales cyanobacterium USR001]